MRSPTNSQPQSMRCASGKNSSAAIHDPNTQRTNAAHNSGPAKVATKSNRPAPGKSSRSSKDRSDSTHRPMDGNGSAASTLSKSQDVDAARNGKAANGRPNTHTQRAASNGHDEATSVAQPQRTSASYAFLALAAETLEDIERARIAAENRARALVHPEQNICLPEDHPHVTLANGIASELAAVEHRAELALKRMVRETPLGQWVKQTVGIGEKQAGRLLGVIGNPRIRIDGETGEIHDRTVGQLWSYCGYAVVSAGDHGARGTQRQSVPGVAPHRKRGEQTNWNPKARMRTYLIAESCMKSPTSPYRKVYEEGREKYAEAKHKTACAQCGTKGKPAQAGTDLRDGHKHARALRLVAKTVLKDLWLAADHG